MVCCDEKVRKSVLKLSAWLADQMENVMIHGILSNRCPICIGPPNEFGELPDAIYDTQPYPTVDAVDAIAADHTLDSERKSNGLAETTANDLGQKVVKALATIIGITENEVPQMLKDMRNMHTIVRDLKTSDGKRELAVNDIQATVEDLNAKSEEYGMAVQVMKSNEKKHKAQPVCRRISQFQRASP